MQKTLQLRLKNLVARRVHSNRETKVPAKILETF